MVWCWRLVAQCSVVLLVGCKECGEDQDAMKHWAKVSFHPLCPFLASIICVHYLCPRPLFVCVFVCIIYAHAHYLCPLFVPIICVHYLCVHVHYLYVPIRAGW